MKLIIPLAIALVLIVALLLVVGWLGRRRRSVGKRLRVIERIDIARNAQLMLVRRDGEEHLVCLTESGGFLVEGNIRNNTKRAAPSPPAVHEPHLAPPAPPYPQKPAVPRPEARPRPVPSATGPTTPDRGAANPSASAPAPPPGTARPAPPPPRPRQTAPEPSAPASPPKPQTP